jgi:hypothetical protein
MRLATFVLLANLLRISQLKILKPILRGSTPFLKKKLDSGQLSTTGFISVLKTGRPMRLALTRAIAR